MNEGNILSSIMKRTLEHLIALCDTPSLSEQADSADKKQQGAKNKEEREHDLYMLLVKQRHEFKVLIVKSITILIAICLIGIFNSGSLMSIALSLATLLGIKNSGN